MKKLLPYILIMIVLVGLFGLGGKTLASTTNPTEPCQDNASNKPCTPTATTSGTCRYYDSAGKRAIERTTRLACQKPGVATTWEPSTLAEFEAERATLNTTGGGTGDGGGTTTSTEQKGDCSFPQATGQQEPPRETQHDKTKAECDTLGGVWVSGAVYTFLAPLPCTGGPETGCVDGKLTTFNPKTPNNLGVYLNLMIKLFIGICAVLAVVMIVIGGLQYMTTELISSKEEGKERIIHAIMGLILALAAYTLLYTINPDLLKTDLSSLKDATVEVALTEQLKSYSGQGTCEPITSGICSPASLAMAGFLPEPPRATQASSICNGESRGNSGLASGVDKCKDGNSFSFGLFQVNVIAHANELPNGVCSGIFEVNGGGTQGACMPGKSTNGICFERDCKVINQAKYQTCRDYITNTTNNIKYAISLQASRGWSQWGAYNSCKGKF